MPTTVAILSQKGGVGKTTTAVTLASGFANQGYRVLLVDLDTQGNVADNLESPTVMT
jgi:chromosome partitioning protein